MIIIFIVRVSVRAGTRAILTRLRKRTNVRKISTFCSCFVFRAKFFPTNTSRHCRRVANYFTASPLLLLLSFTKFTSDFVLEQPSTINVVVWIFYGMVVKTNGKNPRAIERVRMCTIYSRLAPAERSCLELAHNLHKFTDLEEPTVDSCNVFESPKRSRRDPFREHRISDSPRSCKREIPAGDYRLEIFTRSRTFVTS